MTCPRLERTLMVDVSTGMAATHSMLSFCGIQVATVITNPWCVVRGALLVELHSTHSILAR